MVPIKEKTAKIWEYKVGINVNIVIMVIIVHFVKTSTVCEQTDENKCVWVDDLK